MKKPAHYFLASFFVVTCLSFTALNLNSFLEPQTKVLGAEVSLPEQEAFWVSLISENPTYFDGWIELAKVAREMGDNDLYQGALATAREIKPNSEIFTILP